MPLDGKTTRDLKLWAIEVTLGKHAAYNHALASMSITPIQWLTSDVVAQASTLVEYLVGTDAAV